MSTRSEHDAGMLNQALNWGSAEQEKEKLANRIDQVETELLNLRRELQFLSYNKTTQITAGMVEALSNLYGVTLHVTDNKNIIVVTHHPLNFLYSTKQETCHNNAVFFTTPTMFITRLVIDGSRQLGVTNRHAEYPPSLEYARFIRSNNYSHPHATGTPNTFHTICTGDNKWRQNIKDATNPTDFNIALTKFCIWARSANIPDMHDSKMTPPVEVDSPSVEVIALVDYWMRRAYPHFKDAHALEDVYKSFMLETDTADSPWVLILRNVARVDYWAYKLYAEWLYFNRHCLAHTRRSLQHALLSSIFYHSSHSSEPPPANFEEFPKAFKEILSGSHPHITNFID